MTIATRPGRTLYRRVGGVAVPFSPSGSLTYAAAVLADSPDVFWEMQETSGTVMADSSGNGRDGTYLDTPTLATASLVPGEPGLKSVTFDGPNDHAAWSNSVITRAANWTVSGWIRPDLPSFAEGQFWGTNYDGSKVSQSLRVTSSKFIAAFFSSGWKEAPAPANFANGTVYHVAITWDGTSLRLYINGVLVNTTTPGGSTSGGSMNWFYLANRWDDGDRPPCGMSHVAIWTTVLSGAQIAAHAAAGGLTIPDAPIGANDTAGTKNIIGAPAATKFQVDTDCEVSSVEISVLPGFTMVGGKEVGIASDFSLGASVPWLGKGLSVAGAAGTTQEVVLDTPATLVTGVDYWFVNYEDYCTGTSATSVPSGVVGFVTPPLRYGAGSPGLGSTLANWHLMFVLIGH